jgi:hypothetical protein
MTSREVGAILTRRHIKRLIRNGFFEKKAYGNQASLSNRISLAYRDMIVDRSAQIPSILSRSSRNNAQTPFPILTPPPHEPSIFVSQN